MDLKEDTFLGEKNPFFFSVETTTYNPESKKVYLKGYMF